MFPIFLQIPFVPKTRHCQYHLNRIIDQSAAHWRIPVILGYDIYSGDISNSNGPICGFAPPKVGDTIGILLDFKTSDWNGCIRFFKNKKEFCELPEPIVDNLLARSFIWEKVPPISLYFGCWPQSKFQCTLKQYPFVPQGYNHLFDKFRTEKLRIKNAIELMKKESNENEAVFLQILNVFMRFLPNLQKYDIDHSNADNTLKLIWSVNSLISEINKIKQCSICPEFKFAPQFVAFFYKVYHNVGFDIDSNKFNIYGEFGVILHALWVQSMYSPINVMICIMAMYVCKLPILRHKIMSAFGVHCCQNGHYQIGMRMLMKIIKNNEDPIHEEAKKCVLQMLDKINDLKCTNCGGRNKKLFDCKGCMKVRYCCRKCQKYHWKKSHRIECDRSWNTPVLYNILCNVIKNA